MLYNINRDCLCAKFGFKRLFRILKIIKVFGTIKQKGPSIISDLRIVSHNRNCENHVLIKGPG